jgi:hypothetical protein
MLKIKLDHEILKEATNVHSFERTNTIKDVNKANAVVAVDPSNGCPATCIGG